MSIQKDIILLIGAMAIAVVAIGAVPVATISSLDASPEQRTSHLIWRSSTQSSWNGGVDGHLIRSSGTPGGRDGGVDGHLLRTDGTDLSAPAAVSDTLRHSVRRGDVLIIDLPEELDGRPVDSYSLLHAPALSWLIDYSFMWRTLAQDAGRHNVLIRADALADTLVLAIEVE